MSTDDEAVRRAILSLLRQHPAGLTKRELRQVIGFGPEVGRAFMGLASAGVIRYWVENGRHLWTVSDEAER